MNTKILNQKLMTSFSILALLSGPSFYSQKTAAAEISFEKDQSLPLVHISVVFKGGAVTDPEHKNGATDIMARLMLRGTKSKTKNQMELTLDQLGSSLSVDTHAEYLAFHGSVLSENVKPFMDLLSEVITAPSFRLVELEKLKKEQMSEIAEEVSQDSALARLRFDQVFFKGHPYSKTNDGKVGDIKTLTQADLQAQYQKLIRDTQMLVLASGDTDRTAFDSFLNTVRLTRNANTAPIAAVPEFKNTPKKLRVIIFDKPDRTQAQVRLGQLGVPIKSLTVDALTLGNDVFGGHGFTSRLMTELRVKRGWTYGASSNFKMGSQPHTWKAGFSPKNGDTPAAVAESIKMIRDLKEKGITPEEFNFSRQSLINSASFSYNTPAKRMENTLVEKVFGLPDGYQKNEAARLAGLTRDQVNEALHQFLTPDHMMIGIVATASTIKKDLAQALGIKETDIEVQNYLSE